MLRKTIAPLLALLLTIMIPVLLTLVSVRLVMTPVFLELVYQRPGFPEDIYGFTLEDRLYYAPFALDYMIYNKDISYLGDLRFENGAPMYNARELRHMVDVQIVTNAAFLVLIIGGVLAIVAGVVLWRVARQDFYRALLQAGLLTWGIILTIVFAAVVAWDFFFTAFHQLFFEDGTWVFLFSDTLIRLFPEAFWFDAAITIGVLTLLGASACIFIWWRRPAPQVA